MATKDSITTHRSGEVIWTCTRFNVKELNHKEFQKFELICDTYKTCAECLKEVNG
jgi:hypothetical protein